MSDLPMPEVGRVPDSAAGALALSEWDGFRTEGSLCTGYNGLGLAVEEELGTELLWYSEIEPAPAAVMAARYPGVPNLGDLTALAWEDVPAVDVMTAGYPCQPFQPRREAAGHR